MREDYKPKYIERKHTGQCMHYTSDQPEHVKVSTIKTPVRRAKTVSTYPCKKNYDIYKSQIFKKITIFRNILNIRQPCLDCIHHFSRAISQGYIIWPIGN